MRNFRTYDLAISFYRATEHMELPGPRLACQRPPGQDIYDPSYFGPLPASYSTLERATANSPSLISGAFTRSLSGQFANVRQSSTSSPQRRRQLDQCSII